MFQAQIQHMYGARYLPYAGRFSCVIALSRFLFIVSSFYEGSWMCLAASLSPETVSFFHQRRAPQCATCSKLAGVPSIPCTCTCIYPTAKLVYIPVTSAYPIQHHLTGWWKRIKLPMPIS